MKFEPIAYAVHYGGRCRGCADENGVCPTTGMPCDPDESLKAAAHCLKAWQYGIAHGFIDNPFQPPASADLETIERVSTEAAMSQWERSLQRPDLTEKDRVRGAIEAYKRQAFAFSMAAATTGTKGQTDE